MTCPTCRAAGTAGAAFCRNCGTPLARVEDGTAGAPANGTSAVTMAATAEMAGRTCPYCRFALKQDGEVTQCGACHAVHHAECFTDNGGCAVVGCAGAPSVTSGSPPAPAVAPPTVVLGASDFAGVSRPRAGCRRRPACLRRLLVKPPVPSHLRTRHRSPPRHPGRGGNRPRSRLASWPRSPAPAPQWPSRSAAAGAPRQ